MFCFWLALERAFDRGSSRNANINETKVLKQSQIINTTSPNTNTLQNAFDTSIFSSYDPRTLQLPSLTTNSTSKIPLHLSPLPQSYQPHIPKHISSAISLKHILYSRFLGAQNSRSRSTIKRRHTNRFRCFECAR